MARIPVGPHLVRWTEWTLTLLRGAGIPDRVAAFAGDLLGLYLGASDYEATLAPAQSPTGEPLSAEALVAMIRGYYESLPAEQFPNVLATLDELFSGSPDERFELGVEVILRAWAPTPGADGAGPPGGVQLLVGPPG
jgi:tetracycline repressor-like protein